MWVWGVGTEADLIKHGGQEMHPLYDLRETGVAERMREVDVRAARRHTLMSATSETRPARQAGAASTRLRRALRALAMAR